MFKITVKKIKKKTIYIRVKNFAKIKQKLITVR